MQKVVGVKKDFDKEIYYFLSPDEIKIGDRVVVLIDELLTVATVKTVIDKTTKFDGIDKIKRIANNADIEKFAMLQKKAADILPEVKKKSLKLGLDMKFVGAVYSLDNSKIVIIFSSEDRVDFRQFLKELAAMFKTRIELRQIGQRDEIKIKGAVGQCGEPCCCARFLKDFTHVSVKMAKTQGLALSPTKINGVCGRLMCCLAYESKQYDEILSKMPKVGSEITTPKGKGEVVFNDILRERVSVKRTTDGDSFVVEDFALEELEQKSKQEQKIENNFDNKPQKFRFNKPNNRKNKEDKKIENKLSEEKSDKKPINQNREKSDNKYSNKHFKHRRSMHNFKKNNNL